MRQQKKDEEKAKYKRLEDEGLRKIALKAYDDTVTKRKRGEKKVLTDWLCEVDQTIQNKAQDDIFKGTQSRLKPVKEDEAKR